ncbi:MAG: YqgE/AlgH family protein [Acidimicrobiia bacterium]
MDTVVEPGRLLVAAPNLMDPNFVRGVVLVVEHGPDGTVGVVLNHPTDADAREPLPAWAGLVGDPELVFIGGPVQREVAVGMARAEGEVGHPSWMPVTNSVGLLDLSLDPEKYGPVAEVRIFSGYAGWGSGQLDAELDEPAWFVVDGRESDPFTRQPEELWRQVLRRQEGELALYSTYPLDPSDN